MNYQQLEEKLNSPIAYSYRSDNHILEQFKKQFFIVPYDDDFMFIFNHDRDFQNHNHIISIHQKYSGRYPPHMLHYIVIKYVYSGSLTITVEHEKVTLNKGDIIILDKHVPHSIESTSKDDLGVNIIIHENYFFNRFINRLPEDQLITQFFIELMNHQHTHNHYLRFHTNQDHLIHNCIQNILCEYFEHTISSDDIIDSYIMILISHLARKGQYNTNLSISMFRNQQIFQDILHYIKDNYQDGNLKTMCQNLGYSSPYLCKLIKNFSGKTFKELVYEERIKKTMILLQNQELPIYEIALQVGINNLTSFYKKFEEYAQCTPQEYRNKLFYKQ